MTRHSTTPEELLTTGQAARLLGTSRQHVVDLCRDGRLGYHTVGTHRRVSRRDVEAIRLLPQGLTRDQRRSLWLHRAVAGKLTLDPPRVLAIARRNLARMREVHAGGAVQADFAEWQALLDGPLDALLDSLVSKSPRALDLRQSSPFAGALSEAERRRALTSFRMGERAA